MQNTRDSLRSKILGKSQSFRREKVIDDEGNEYEVLQPTIRQRADLRKSTTKVKKDGVEFDFFEFMIRAAIAFTVVPGTTERVFDDEDYDSIVSQPSGGFTDRLCQAASAVCNIDDAEEKKS